MTQAQDFTLIAHRGFSARAPENTFAAFDLAVAHGFRHIELDLRLSADGEIVVIHDETADRTTSGGGTVAEMDYADISVLSAGSWFHPRFMGERVPRLVDVVRRYGRNCHVQFELKSSDSALAGAVIDFFRRHRSVFTPAAESDVFPIGAATITSKHADPLREVASALAPVEAVDVALLTPRLDGEALDVAHDSSFDGLFPKSDELTAAQVETVVDAGLKVRSWATPEQRVTSLARLGVQGATVNNPALARGHLIGAVNAPVLSLNAKLPSLPS